MSALRHALFAFAMSAMMAVSAPSAQALDVGEYRLDGRCQAVALGGEIRRDEAKTAVQRIVEAAERCGTGTLVMRQMPGGSVTDAVEIGAAIRARDYVTAMLPDSLCASACGLVYVAGVQRYWRPRGRFIIHRPDIRRSFASPAEEMDEYEKLRSRLTRYVAAMGGSPDYVDAMYAVPAGSHQQLDERDLTRLGLVTVTGSPFAGR